MSTSIRSKISRRITVLLTHRCNQRCEFCFDASNILYKSVNIKLSIIDKTIDLLKGSLNDGLPFNILLSGGEPTIHPQFLEIVKRYSDAGFPITILSNGQKFADKDFMAKVLKYNIYNLQFSIEGASSEVHDFRVGCEGAWNKVIHAIENAQEFGIAFATNSTMTSTSINEMFKLIDLLDTLHVRNMSISNTTPECTGRNYSVLMSYPNIIEIVEKLTLYALTKSISLNFISPLPFCLKEQRIINGFRTCGAGYNAALIDTDGTLRPCSACNPLDIALPSIELIGSYYAIHDKLSDVIEKYLTKYIPQDCVKCSKFRQCKAACPLYWKIPGIDTPSKWIISNNVSDSLNQSDNIIDSIIDS